MEEATEPCTDTTYVYVAIKLQCTIQLAASQGGKIKGKRAALENVITRL